MKVGNCTTLFLSKGEDFSNRLEEALAKVAVPKPVPIIKTISEEEFRAQEARGQKVAGEPRFPIMG